MYGNPSSLGKGQIGTGSNLQTMEDNLHTIPVTDHSMLDIQDTLLM